MVRRGSCWRRVANPLSIGRCDAAHHVPTSTPQTQMQCTTASRPSLCLILPGEGTIVNCILSQIKVKTHLKDGKILQDAVHHVLFRQSLEFVYEVDHVVAHRRPVNAVHVASVLQSRKFRLHLLDNLLPEWTDLCRTRDPHALVTLKATNKTKWKICLRNSRMLRVLTDYWHHKMLQHHSAGWYWDRPRTSQGRRHSVGPFHTALWDPRSSAGTCHKSPLHRRIPGVDGMADLLYVQRDACDTEKRTKINEFMLHWRTTRQLTSLTASSALRSRYAENSTSLNLWVAIDRPSHGCWACRLPSIADTAVAVFPPVGYPGCENGFTSCDVLGWRPGCQNCWKTEAISRVSHEYSMRLKNTTKASTADQFTFLAVKQNEFEARVAAHGF